MGWLLLNALQAVFLAVWSVFWISLALVVTVVAGGDAALAMARRFWAPGLIRAAGARVKVDPLPDIDWSKPHIFVMNHQSMFDVPLAFAHIPVNIRFVAKHTLRLVPFLGWYMAMTGMVFVDRSKRPQAVQSLFAAGERIRQGANILAFPEGTRSRDGRILPFKKGIFVLALEAQVPIVPIAIEGSGKVLPADGFRVRPGEVRVKMGAPIHTASRTAEDRDELMREVRDALISLHREIGGPASALSEAARAA